MILHFKSIFISCFITTLISFQSTCKTVNNCSLTTIRYAQHKWSALMPFENNGTFQKWHVTNTPLEIDKHDTHKKWYLTKMTHLAKKYPKDVVELVVLQKTNNVIVRYHSCWVSFLRCVILVKRSALFAFCNTVSNGCHKS